VKKLLTILILLLLAGCVSKSMAPKDVAELLIKSYNDRDADTIYNLLSSPAKLNYSKDYVEDEIKDASRLNITVHDWNIVEESLNYSKAKLKLKVNVTRDGEIRNLCVNLTLSKEGERWLINDLPFYLFKMVFTPPAIVTPLPPDIFLECFVNAYNERDSKSIYKMLSDSIKRNHSLSDVESELKFAENNKIEITNTKILKRVNIANKRILTVNFTLSFNGSVKNLVYNFSIIYIPFERSINGLIYEKGWNGFIDCWIFEKFKNIS